MILQRVLSRRWVIAWLLWVAAFFAIEIPGLRTPNRHGTLSYQLGALYRTRTRRGKFLFAVSASAAIGALTAHILTDVDSVVSTVPDREELEARDDVR